MTGFDLLGLSFVAWLIITVLLLILHMVIGLPNVFYLFKVYRNFGLSWKRGTLKGLEISKLKSKAYLTWIDDNIHMNNSIYFCEFERGRRDWFFRIGFYTFSQKYNCGVVLAGITTRFRKEIKPLVAFQVHTKLIYYDESHIYLEQRIVSTSNGMVHCIAFADCSVVDRKLKKRTSTDNFIKFIGLIDGEKKQLKSNVPQSLLHWIEYLSNSSSEIRAESGLAPKKQK